MTENGSLPVRTSNWIKLWSRISNITGVWGNETACWQVVPS